ncbi:MAG TPA: glycerate kinase [Propionibacteriaceae bacterium]|nr:glycerate kinase [Propionibacteriaceae bacterium]
MTARRKGHIVVAPDKFRGSRTAAEVAADLRAGLLSVAVDADVVAAPIADGGEGTVEAALASGYTRVPVTVTGPDGAPVQATIAVSGDTAVVELAQASGLQLVTQVSRQPLRATSYGTGELIRAGLDAGCRTIVLGLGGSANTDGGAGMVQALGARVLDRSGHDVSAGGGALVDVSRVDLTGMDPRVESAAFIVARDVDNVLLGSDGAAAVFAPQKGATGSQIAQLEAGLARWSDAVASAVGKDFSAVPGAGAAGGVGFAAMAFLNAQSRPGVELLLEMVGFPELLPGARLVITGEGSLDMQSLGGKVPVGVARAAGRHQVPTIAVAGVTSLPSDTLTAAGFQQTYTLQQIEPDLSVCMTQADRLLQRIGQLIAKDWLSS